MTPCGSRSSCWPGRDKLAQAVWKQASQRPEPGARRSRTLLGFLSAEAFGQGLFPLCGASGQPAVCDARDDFPAPFRSRMDGALVSVADEIFGPQVTTRFFEYGPNISVRGEVGGGQWGARMPGLAFGEWLKVLRGFQPSALDYQGYREPLKAAFSSDATDVMAQFAPLINLGLEEGRGPLIPVADVTAATACWTWLGGTGDAVWLHGQFPRAQAGQ